MKKQKILIVGNGKIGQAIFYLLKSNPSNKKIIIEVYDKDITKNTLPTYNYLRSMFIKKDQNKSRPSSPMTAVLSTLAIEVVSRLNLLKYYVFSFQKPR